MAGAFHSRLMKSAGVGLKPVLNAAGLKMPAVPVYHNLTAAPAATLPELKTNLAGQVAGSVAAVSGYFTFIDSFTLTLPGIAGIILSIGMGEVFSKPCLYSLNLQINLG